MPIEPTDLNALDADTVATAIATVTQLISEANPDLDLKRGVIHDTVVYYGALLQAQLRESLARYISARSLLQIEADPTLADPGVVDDLLSNWNVTREDGSTAGGEVTIVLNSPISVTIGTGTIFTANGLTFTANEAYTAKPEASQINDSSDRLLTELDDGTYAFTINVTATTVGSAYILRKDTLIVPSALPTDYLTSYVTDDFTGGLDAETNDQLLTRFQQGIAAKATSNRVNMAATLRANASFTSAVGSIVGCSDEEMIRDQHTIFPGSVGGGRVDWYVRSQPTLATLTLTKTCVLTAITENNVGTWAASVTRDDAPGFYEIVSIRPPTSADFGTLTLVTDVRGLDLTGPDFVPDIATVAEGAYSRYQTTAITFNDDATGLAVGATASYQITVSYLPQVDALQAFAGSYDNRGVGSDVLVKAPIPCFVNVSLSIAKKYTQADPDTSAIAAALANVVNGTGFIGRLYASQLQDAIGGLLPEGMSAGSIDMLGRIRRPDGQTTWLRRSREVLVVPSINGTMVSPRTVQFFLDPANVSVDIRSEIPVPT
jgi:uncharacterized phage protein gp47/JayE